MNKTREIIAQTQNNKIKIRKKDFEKLTLFNKVKYLIKNLYANMDEATKITTVQAFLTSMYTFLCNITKSKKLKFVYDFLAFSISIYSMKNILEFEEDECSEVELKVKRILDKDYVHQRTVSVTEQTIQCLLNCELDDVVKYRTSITGENYIDYFNKNEKGTLFIKIGNVIKNEEYIISVEYFTYGNVKSFTNIKAWNGDYSDEDEIRTLLNHIFLKHADIKNNYLYITGSREINFLPKQTRDISIYQLDVGRIVKSINRLFEANLTSSMMLIGKQGTGKTMTVRKIIQEFPNNVVLWIDNDNFSTTFKIDYLFSVIRQYENCIVVFDDLDGGNLEEKDQRLSVLLGHIDNIYENHSVFFISTVNEPKFLHPTLVNRPGRCDDKFVIKPPTNPDEIKNVIEYAIKKINVNFDKQFDINKAVDAVLHNQFTHAELNNVILYCFKYFNVISKEAIDEAIKFVINNAEISGLDKEEIDSIE